MSAFTLLDGAMGGELQRRGFAKDDSIWSGFALVNHPDEVTKVHDEYLAAGADVIITSNYGVVPVMLAKEGMENRLAELTKLSVACAETARQKSGRSEVEIAGSLPPLEMSYRPDMVQNEEIMCQSYQAITHALAPGVDLFITETLSTIREARAAARAVAGYDKPFWLSMSLDKAADGTLRGGKGMQELVAALADFRVDAFLFNCCSVEAISVALPIMRQQTDKPIGAYANAFGRMPEKYVMGQTGLGMREDLSAGEYLILAQAWRDMGATIIGGCCGIGPDHIALMNTKLR